MARFGFVLGMGAAVAVLAGGAVRAQSLSGIAGQLLGGQSAPSQAAAPQPGGQSAAGLLSGAAGSLLGRALPNPSAAAPDNVAGVLSYCVQNSLVSNGAAASVLGALTGQQGGVATSSSGFLAGQSGTLQTGGGTAFSLSSLTDQLKSQLCSMVLKRAQSLL